MTGVREQTGVLDAGDTYADARDSSVEPMNSFDDPLLAVSRTIASTLQAAGFREIQLGPDLVAPDDDGDFRLDIEDALSPDGLLPVVVRRAAKAYNEARLDASRGFPLAIEKDDDALLGERVVWLTGQPGLAHLGVALSCVSDALIQIISESPRNAELLTFGAKLA